MIKLNGNVIEQGRFPDGTLALKEIDLSLLSNNFVNWIEWLYDGDDEMFTIMSLVDVVKRNFIGKIYLRMSYLPNARMDRIKSNNENFALKVFTNWLNNLGFDLVIVDNVHSNVSNALVNNIADCLPENDINDISIKYNFDVIFFPDEGACKRYKDMNIIKELGLPIAFGIKNRDWKTGEIISLDIMGADVRDKNVLIIDDIYFWENKVPKTQDAFFHIFNYLHQRNKQIIITSDKAPAELTGLEPRLMSRLKWGLSADLQVPNVETRIAILKQKLENDGIEMPYEVIEYIAYNINNNVRELEGALISLMAQSSLNKKQITLDLAKQMIDKFVKNTAREITIDYIQKVICDYFNLPIESIQSHTRKREIVQARQLAMYFAKKMTKSSLAIIGLQCGNKDHATVLHACKTVTNLTETDKKFRFWVEELEKKFKEESEYIFHLMNKSS